MFKIFANERKLKNMQ